MKTRRGLTSARAVADIFGPSLEELFANYLSYLTRAEKPSADGARFQWRVLAPYFARRTVAEIDHNACLAYAKLRRAAGVRDGTIWAELSRLRAALGHAQRCGTISVVPQFWKPSPPRRRERWLTHDEARQLITAASKAPHIRLFIILALATAGREAALLELTWDRVDIELGLIDLDNPKRALTSKRRATVAINAMARDALVDAKARARSPFVIEYGGRAVRCVWAGVAAAAARAGLRGVSPNVLRHTAGSWQAQAGVPLLAIADFMANDVTTAARNYLKLTPGHLTAAAAAVNLEGIAHAPAA